MLPLNSLSFGIRHCRRCPRSKTRTHAVPGEGNPKARVLLLGEAPGRNEDVSGRPFVGRAGRYLDRVLAEHGLSRDRLFVTSILKCFHPRPPKKGDIEACLPWTKSQVAAIDPGLILVMGRHAEGGLFGKARVDKEGEVTDWQGRVCVITCHPAAAMRFPTRDRQFHRSMELLTRLLSSFYANPIPS
jgi:DNA polymerase